MSDYINLNMKLAPKYDVNITKEEIYVGPYLELFTGTIESLNDLIIPDGVSDIRDYLFNNSNSLLSVSSAKISTVGYGSFCSTPLENVYLPNLISAGTQSFAYTNINRIALPRLISVSSEMFNGCENLIEADFSEITSINRFAFYGCVSFDKLIIRNENTIPDLIGENIFYGTKIESGEGRIYVPENMAREYKTFPRWSTYASQILPIEDGISE